MAIPILKFKDLDELVDWQLDNKNLIYTQTFKILNKEWNKNKKCIDVDLFQIFLTEDEEFTTIIESIFIEEWEEALNEALKYFEDKEEYEICEKINKLLLTIKNN